MTAASISTITRAGDVPADAPRLTLRPGEYAQVAPGVAVMLQADRHPDRDQYRLTVRFFVQTPDGWQLRGEARALPISGRVYESGLYLTPLAVNWRGDRVGSVIVAATGTYFPIGHACCPRTR
ncbi:MAG: hypothetical protein OEY28_11930 [Nitrospira sp.]|nr:hypothetical protein [Nitrospira sp.]